MGKVVPSVLTPYWCRLSGSDISLLPFTKLRSVRIILDDDGYTGKRRETLLPKLLHRISYILEDELPPTVEIFWIDFTYHSPHSITLHLADASNTVHWSHLDHQLSDMRYRRPRLQSVIFAWPKAKKSLSDSWSSSLKHCLPLCQRADSSQTYEVETTPGKWFFVKLIQYLTSDP